MPFEVHCAITVKSVTNGAFEIQNFKFKQISLKIKVNKQKQTALYPEIFSTCHDNVHK